MNMEKKAFDPTVEFVVFGSWMRSIEALERVGIETAYRLFKAIADYSMYEEEPDFSDDPYLCAIWSTIEREIDLCVSRRKRGFAADEANENYQDIIKASVSNPDASVRDIAEMTGTSRSMVSRIQRKYREKINNLIAATSGIATDTTSGIATDTASGIATDYDTDSDNDSMRRDSETPEDNIDPYTCRPNVWINLPEDIRKQVSLLDRIRFRMEKLEGYIDNTCAEAVRARSKCNGVYRVWLRSIASEDVNTIITKYLATHKESEVFKKAGDRYGRFIDGWDAEKQEPIIVYSLTGYFPKDTRHNLDGIPIEYYKSPEEEMTEEEERQALLEWISEQDEGWNYDDEPF